MSNSKVKLAASIINASICLHALVYLGEIKFGVFSEFFRRCVDSETPSNETTLRQQFLSSTFLYNRVPIEGNPQSSRYHIALMKVGRCLKEFPGLPKVANLSESFSPERCTNGSPALGHQRGQLRHQCPARPLDVLFLVFRTQTTRLDRSIGFWVTLKTEYILYRDIFYYI